MLHYSSFEVRLPVKCNLWTNLSVFVPFVHYWDEDVLLFYKHSADPLSPSTDLARFSQNHRIKRPSNFKRGFRTTGIYPFNVLIIPDNHLLPVLQYSADAQDSNVVLENETPAAALLSQKTWKASPVPGMTGKIAPTGRNNDMFYSDKEYNVDTGRNAFIASVQRTPEH
jgi:hypothetical protein